jgi:NADPH-dependent F420 reductase
MSTAARAVHGAAASVQVGLLGGTGPEGLGLALRLAGAGHDVLIGSRSEARAGRASRHVAETVAGARVRGVTNAEAARLADIVFLTLPLAGLDAVLDEIRAIVDGKIVVDVVNPLYRHGDRFVLVDLPEGSAAELIRRRLPGARVVSALKTNSAASLARVGSPIDGDVLVCGDDPDARATVAALLTGAAAHVVDGGPLEMAGHIEHVAALLLNLNRRLKATTSLRIIGLPATATPGG